MRARILDAIAEDREVIAYRPKFRDLTRSALGAILLQQILHRAKNNKWKPFYKFAAPCEHQDYAAGDSWTEELGFTEGELETARSYIASKVTHGKSRESFAGTALVFFWTDSNRKTWYQVNEDLLESLLSELYGSQSAKGQIALYLEKRFPALTKKRANRALHSSETSETSERGDSKTESPPPENRTPAVRLCGHPVSAIRSSDEGTQYCQECADVAELDKIPGASTGLAPQAHTSAMASPEIAVKEYKSAVSEGFAAVFLHVSEQGGYDPSRIDKSAARQLYESHFPFARAMEWLAHAANGAGEKIRAARTKEGKPINAYHLIGDMDEWRKAKYPPLDRAQYTVDCDAAITRAALAR